MNQAYPVRLTPRTLLVIPCSGAKRRGSTVAPQKTILSDIDSALATRLASARAVIRESARVDHTQMPAIERYSGELYTYGGPSIRTALSAGHHVIIVSGGYGLVLPDEPIGHYQKVFALREWPSGLLQTCLTDYATRAGIHSVLAIMSRSTDYAKLIRQTDWKSANLQATLVSPLSIGGGAMKTVPRAQGQAIASLVAGGLERSWRSSDSFALEIKNL